jgi:hypothetical protein
MTALSGSVVSVAFELGFADELLALVTSVTSLG